MYRQLFAVIGVFLALSLSSQLVSAQTSRTILALGSTGWLNVSDIQAATGALVKPDLEKFQLKDFAVIVLANIAFGSLPAPVQQGLVEYVNNGGTVLITGGSQSFGSGGYDAVAPVIPFQIRFPSDWRQTPLRHPVPIQPGHPILTGVTFLSVGAVNDMNPRPDASEILQAAGGGSAARRAAGAGGGSFPYPLIAELGVGAGRVIGVATDLNDFADMRDRDLFVRNTIGYLLQASRMGRG